MKEMAARLADALQDVLADLYAEIANESDSDEHTQFKYEEMTVGARAVLEEYRRLERARSEQKPADDGDDETRYINAYGVDERYYDGSGHPEVCRCCGADLSREGHAPNCENAPER